jgi:5-methylcytosine-specific restriction endonuclease McrA
MLPARIPKKPKRASRWRSQAHCSFVRGHACSTCGSTAGIEVAHVRFGSGAGMGQKPDDWRTVSLCKECHQRQHAVGEPTFWSGTPIEELIDAFISASPKRRDIEQAMRERKQ